MARFINCLLDGETVIYRTRLHWTVYSWTIALVIVTAATYLIDEIENIRYLSIIFLGFTVIAALNAFIRQNYTHIVVTNFRVIQQTGLFNRRTYGIMLERLESIDVYQPLWARLVGTGTVAITGTGGSHDVFKQVNQPYEFRRAVLNAATHLRKA